ncbi:MAG: SAM-dependent methyltransferase [Phycisphaerales bacterium]
MRRTRDAVPSAALRRRIAFSLDTPDELAPHLERLFAPLRSLGAMPRRTVSLIASALTPGPRTRVLDAACGKGAVSVLLASRLGCRVTGFDAMPAFIEEARARARRVGVGHLCRFEVSTAEAFFKRPRRFDGAMMLNLWPAPRAVAALRRVVRPGGVMVIDDATLDPRRLVPREFDHMRTLEEMNRLLEVGGDEILRVVRPTPSVVRAQNRVLYRLIERSAQALVGDGHPELAPHARDLLRRQREANRLLATTLRPTMWLIRRG